jgi:hypothetical protein
MLSSIASQYSLKLFSNRQTACAIPVQIIAFILVSSIKITFAWGDTPAALTAIADTADRICGIVATQGETQSSKVAGEVKAELSGLARRLASVGVSGAGDITSSSYQGVLQQDLPTTLRDVRDCKLKVFDRLVATVLPGVVVPSGAGAPSAELLQSPTSAASADLIKDFPRFGLDVGLYSCSNVPGPNSASGQTSFSVSCYGTATKATDGISNYDISELFPKNDIKLFDNFHFEHPLKRGSFIDGLGNHKQTINLSTGESIWWALEFDPVPQRASSARIVISTYMGLKQLRSPVY